MGRLGTLNAIWPPVGWPQLALIQSPTGQSLVKDIDKARIYGLQYRVESVPLLKDETRFFRHDIRISGWEYSILNESNEYPVLSFGLIDRFDSLLPREGYIADIRAYDTHIPHTRGSAGRAVSAGLFLIRQITEGTVPDVNRVLRAYRLHPSQAFLYKKDRSLEPDLRKAFGQGRGWIAARSKDV